MKLYCGIDLHSNNNYLVIIEEGGKVIYQKRLHNDMDVILKELSGYKEKIEGIVVESTYNWYWLVDGLQAADYRVHLANTAALKQYSGLKYTDDKSDAIWLARLLQMGILEEGHIYPKKDRGLRELLRRRLLLVQQQTTSLLGIQSMILRYENIRLSGDKIKRHQNEEEKLLGFVKDEHVRLAVRSQLKILNCLMKQIEILEKTILSKKKKTLFLSY